MFKNREFAIRMRKAEPINETKELREDTMSFDDKLDKTLQVVKTVGQNIALGVVGYVLLDTFRQVQIAKHTHNQDD